MNTTSTNTAKPAPATPPAASAVRRVLNFTRWVLLVPLTIAVAFVVWDWITNGHNDAFYSVRLRHIWWSIRGLAPAWAQSFIPFFLIIPTASIIAPSRKRKVAIAALIFGALASLMLYLPLALPDPMRPEASVIFEANQLCGRILGLLAGGWIVYWALKNREAGRPFLKKTAIVFAVILCAAIVLVETGWNSRGAIETRFEMSLFKTSEDHGMATCSFNMENKTDKELNFSIDLVAERRPDPIKPDNGIKVGSTQIAVSLAPLEHKEFSKQFPIDTSTSATGHLVIYPSKITPPPAKTDSP